MDFIVGSKTACVNIVFEKKRPICSYLFDRCEGLQLSCLREVQKLSNQIRSCRIKGKEADEI